MYLEDNRKNLLHKYHNMDSNNLKLRKTLLGCFSVLAFSLMACNNDSNTPGQMADKSGGDANTLLGAGSTFVYPLFSKQFSEYNKKTSLKVNYQSIGSGGGILQLTNKTVDFGDSDAPLNEEQTKKIGADV